MPRPFTVELQIVVLTELASVPTGFVMVDCSRKNRLARDAHPQFMNTVWHLVKEGYVRPDPQDATWAHWVSVIERGRRLPPYIPAKFERELTERGECSLMIAPRGELRLHQLHREFKDDAGLSQAGR